MSCLFISPKLKLHVRTLRGAEPHLQLRQAFLCVVLVCRPAWWAQQVVNGGQRQGHPVEDMKQTLIQRLIGVFRRGHLKTAGDFQSTDKNTNVFTLFQSTLVLCHHSASL